MLNEEQIKTIINKLVELDDQVMDLLGFVEGSALNGYIIGLKMAIGEVDHNTIINSYQERINNRLNYVEDDTIDEDDHELETTKRCIKCGASLICSIHEDKPICSKCR